MYEVSSDIKRSLIQPRIAVWRNTLYDAGLDYRMYTAIGLTDEHKEVQAAKARMLEAQKAIEFLEQELTDLDNPPPVE